ncbi:MAG TPA: PEGA domain-containing protein [Polyangia bacterium]|nr:PEGA domain-containing protein [Polyangia bacterium]
MRTIPILFLLPAFWSATAHAAPSDNKAEARIHFDQGVQLYRDGDFQAAAIEFRRAYDTEPNYRVLYNIGQACTEGKDYACALSAFTSYLEQGGPEVAAARQSQLQQQIEKLRLRTGRLSIRSNVEGATVQVDDVAVGKTPLAAALLVSAGRRKIVLVSPSGVQQLRAVEVAGGDVLTADVIFPGVATFGQVRASALDAAKDAPMEPSGDVNPETMSPLNRKLAIVIPAALTAALIIGATLTGLQALDSKNQFDDAVANLPGERDFIETQRTRTRNWALASDLMTGGAIVGGVVTLLAILNYRSASNEASVSISPNNVAFTTRF